MSELKIYKMNPNATMPVFGTSGSACFDLTACLINSEITGFNDAGSKPFVKKLNSNGALVVYPNERILVPTGLIFDIPDKHCVKLYARSGLAFKKGLTLANGIGIIDSDYVEEIKIILHNSSDMNCIINNGDRISQGEMVKCLPYTLTETEERPERKTERDGGFGSTGS